MPEGFTGSRDVWHVHDFEKVFAAAFRNRPIIGWLANGWLDNEMRPDGRTRVAMVHLWLIPNPEGQFASHNPVLAYLDLGLPASWADGVPAARGVALASPDGCEESLGGRLWIADVSRATRRALMRTCAGLADDVRRAIPAGKTALNTAGRWANTALEQAVDSRLTSAEKARIASIVEHG